MRKVLNQFFRSLLAFTAIVFLMAFGVTTYASAAGNNAGNDSASRYITVDGKKMHVVLYGDINSTDQTFADQDKTALVMLPGLGVPSPHIYFKPLAQALESKFNVVIVEPLGYGLSDVTSTDRTVENMNNELDEALEILDIDECVLAVHSISGVYGLDFVLDYPERVKGFIAIDNTIYEDSLVESLEMEKDYMLQEAEKFDNLRNSFTSIQEFQNAISENPEQYGAALPQINGYTYSQSDREEYIQAYSRSSNETIKNEITQISNSLQTIKGKKFPDSLPVLTMMASDNVEGTPEWEEGHRNQLNLESGNHELYTLEGSHYIWYTNLSGVVERIVEWQAKNQF